MKGRSVAILIALIAAAVVFGAVVVIGQFGRARAPVLDQGVGRGSAESVDSPPRRVARYSEKGAAIGVEAAELCKDDADIAPAMGAWIRVVNEDAEPIVGAEVVVGTWHRVTHVSMGQWTEYKTDVLGRARTNQDGKVAIPVLPEVGSGEKFMIVTAPGYQPFVDPAFTEGHDGALDRLIRLERSSALLIQVSSRSDGTPVMGAQLEVIDFAAEETVENRLFDELRAQGWTSDEEGRVLLDQLPSGPQMITVMAPGFLAWHGRTRGGESRIEIALEPGPLIVGCVIAAETGIEISGWTLRATGCRNLQVLSGGAAAEFLGRAASPGLFVGRCLEEGDLELHVEGEGLASGSFSLAGLQSGIRRDLLLSVPRGSRIEGRVLDAKAEAIAGAEILVLRDARRAATEVEFAGSPTFLRQESFQVQSDALGRIVITGLSAGSYEISASHPNFFETVQATVEVVAGETRSGLELRFAAEAVVSMVVLGPDGKAFTDVEIEVWSDEEADGCVAIDGEEAPGETLLSEWPLESRLVREGDRFLVRALPPGRYLVSATSRDGAAFRASAWIDLGQEDASLELQLLAMPPRSPDQDR